MCVQEKSEPIGPTHRIEIKEAPQYGGLLCSCIQYARSLGVDIPQPTDAEDIVTNSMPVENGLVVFRYKKYHHVGVITSLEGEGFWIDEANYNFCERSKRFIYYDDPFIRGFYTAPQ